MNTIFRTFACTVALAVALPVAAQDQSPLSAAEFESYTTGKTLYFNAGGMAYGVEEYRPGRRVRWSFLDGRCKDGEWYPEGEQICFVYEDGTGPQCWTFFQGSNGLRARFMGDPAGSELYEARDTDEPMVCMGPDVGA
ncbi:hypothetical protein [Oceaniglobus indicus]|uniref:hypothetical protein n=1 Tax=Oceaniglobus indicus TaxID=2047749 RepID=UPI000C17BE63|nr:hypothetical protein [Oceaniglobus indicus]